MQAEQKTLLKRPRVQALSVIVIGVVLLTVLISASHDGNAVGEPGATAGDAAPPAGHTDHSAAADDRSTDAVAVAAASPAEPGVFLEEFSGTPPSPQPWSSPRWDVQIHVREQWQDPNSFPGMEAHHGPDCAPFPATHTIDHDPPRGVFQCNNHIMTSLKGDSYGLIYLTPNVLVDFSEGEAVIRFDLSTLRTSLRDWVDLWITPWEDDLARPLDSVWPDLQGEPRNAIHVGMTLTDTGQTKWSASLIRDFKVEFLAEAAPYTGQESFLDPSATRRDTYELRLSTSWLRFEMPQYGHVFVDAPLPHELTWDRAVVTFGHHSYTPQKDCTPDRVNHTCLANTWHWDNVQIEPATPFTMLSATPRIVSSNNFTPREAVFTLPQPAPDNAILRYVYFGNKCEVSFDEGKTWVEAKRAAQPRNEAHYANFRQPIPAGTTKILFRGTGGWWGSHWSVSGVGVWAEPPKREGG